MTFEDSIHRVSLSGSEISSILYALEGWIQANDEYNEGGDLSLDIDNVFTALEEVADSWEGEFADPKVTYSDKVYPEVEDVPEQVYKEWLYNKDDNYGEKVDRLVDNMGMRKYKWDEQFYNEIVKDSKFSYGKFNEINYPLHLQQQ